MCVRREPVAASPRPQPTEKVPQIVPCKREVTPLLPRVHRHFVSKKSSQRCRPLYSSAPNITTSAACSCISQSQGRCCSAPTHHTGESRAEALLIQAVCTGHWLLPSARVEVHPAAHSPEAAFQPAALRGQIPFSPGRRQHLLRSLDTRVILAGLRLQG